MRRLIFAVLLGATAAASAQMYRWTDQSGRVNITDTPPPPGAKNVQRKNLPGSASGESGATSYAHQEAAKRFPVTLYTSADCGALCREAKLLLDKRGVPYQETLVVSAADIEALKKAIGQTQVPSMLVGMTPQVGLEAEAWNAALDAAGYPRQPAPGARAGAAKPSALPPVKLYTNSLCGQLCEDAKALLAGRGVAFETVEIEDEAGLEELKQVSGGASVPVLTVGKAVYRGYNPGLYANALDTAGFPRR